MNTGASAAVRGISATGRISLGCAALATALFGGNVHALEEVLVKATRRADTDIQTTPVSVTAITADNLETMIPHDITDIAPLVPNLIGGNVAGFNAAAFGMRGVGQTSIIIYQEAPVGVVVDDFVIPHIQTQALEPFDIEAIEVLRGPQGTLFGKNTTAGVINVRTKRPVLGERSAEGRITYGSFDTIEGRFALNFGLGDTLAVRASGLYQSSDGYYEAGKRSTSFDPIALRDTGMFIPVEFNGDGSDLGGDDVFSGRFKALWQPNEDFSALFQYEIIRDDQDSPPVVNESPPSLVFPSLGFTGVTTGDPIEQSAISNRDDGLKMRDGHQVDVDGFYVNLEWDVGQFTLYSVTGYREQESFLPSTYMGETRGSLFDAARADDRETFQQEFRIASNFGGPLEFVGGVFYQENDAEFCVVQFLGFLDYFGAGFAPNTLLGGFGVALPVNTHNDNPSILCNRQDSESFALFGDVTFELSDEFTVGFGARWTEDTKEWAGRSQIFPQLINGIAAFDPNFTLQSLGDPLNAADFGRFPFNVKRDNETWSEPSFRGTISYQPVDDIFTWFTIARSYKAGAYNDQTGTSTIGLPIPFPDAAARPVDPEIATSFELGLKTDLLDDRLRLNMVFFDVVYENGQRELVADIPLGGGLFFEETRFFNAAEISARGVELEVAADVTEGLTVNANLGYLDSKFEKFEVDTDFDGIIDQVLSGRPVTRAPELTATIAATYTHQFMGYGRLTHNFNVVYEDENIHVYSPVDPAFDGIIDEKTLLNWSSTFTSNDDRYMLRVFGRNLTDERYRTGILPVANLWTMTSYGIPQMFGVEVGAKLDF